MSLKGSPSATLPCVSRFDFVQFAGGLITDFWFWVVVIVENSARMSRVTGLLLVLCCLVGFVSKLRGK